MRCDTLNSAISIGGSSFPFCWVTQLMMLLVLVPLTPHLLPIPAPFHGRCFPRTDNTLNERSISGRCTCLRTTTQPTVSSFRPSMFIESNKKLVHSFTSHFSQDCVCVCKNHQDTFSQLVLHTKVYFFHLPKILALLALFRKNIAMIITAMLTCYRNPFQKGRTQ